MMKKIFGVVFVAIFLFGAAAVHAGSPAVEGTVVKITKDSITLQVGSDQQTFTYGRSLRFTVNGKTPSEALTVKAGDKAKIVADKNNVAGKVDIAPQNAPANAGGK